MAEDTKIDDIYHDGWFAFFKGGINPYDPGTIENIKWEAGYNMAQLRMEHHND